MTTKLSIPRRRSFPDENPFNAKYDLARVRSKAFLDLSDCSSQVAKQFTIVSLHMTREKASMCVKIDEVVEPVTREQRR